MSAAPAREAGGVRISRQSGGVLAFILAPTLAAIDDGRLEIERYLQTRALSPKALNRLEVMFEELVSNVVRHGLSSDREHAILVTIAADDREARLAIEDDGRPFDPFVLAESAQPRSLEEAAIGGLGIPAVRRMATRTAYELQPESPLWDELVRRPGPVNRVVVILASGGRSEG